MGQMRRDLNKTFLAHFTEAAERIRAGLPPLPMDYDTRWTRDYVRQQKEKMPKIGIAGSKWALAELEEPTKAIGETVDSLLVVGDPEDFLVDPINIKVDAWLEKVASDVTKRNAAQIQKVHDEAVAYRGPNGEALTPSQIARKIEKIAPEFTRHRARMIAFTDTNQAFNVGARVRYADLNVTVLEWMTSEDDAVCPFCQAMDGVKIRIEDSFWPEGATMTIQDGDVERRLNIKHGCENPPLHPFCGCVILPVIETLSVAVTQDDSTEI